MLRYDTFLGRLVEEGGTPTPTPPPIPGETAVLAYRTTTLGASSGVIGWDAEEYDRTGWHDNSTNNNRLTVPNGVSYARAIFQGGRSGEGTNAGDMDMETRRGGVAAALGMAKNGIFISGHTGLLNNLYTGIVAVTPGDYFDCNLIDGRFSGGTAHNWAYAEEIDPQFLGALLVGNNAGLTGTGNPKFAWVDTETGCYDVDGVWDSGSPTRVTIQSDGWYRISACVFDSAPGDGGIYLYKNGAIMNSSTGVYCAGSNDGSGDGGIQLCTPPLYLTAGDYFEIGMFFTATMEYDVRTWICLEKCDPNLRRCLVRRAAAMSFNSGNGIAMQFDSEAYDPEGMFDAGVSNTNITIPADATRLRVSFGSGYEESAGQWALRAAIDNTATVHTLDREGLPGQSAGVSATGDPMCGLGGWMDVAGSEVVSLRAYSENNRTGFAANEGPWLCVETD